MILECSKSKMVNISHNEEIMESFDDEFSPSGVAILLSHCKDNKEQFQMLSELSSWLLMQTNSCLNNLSTINYFDEYNKQGDINSDLKETIYEMNKVNQWMQNCFSVRNPDLDELASFDKIELKIKLQKVIDSL
jgi:hypothetical protein